MAWTIDLQLQMMIAEALAGWLLDGLFEGGLLCLEGVTLGVLWNMPLIHEVILTEGY